MLHGQREANAEMPGVQGSVGVAAIDEEDDVAPADGAGEEAVGAEHGELVGDAGCEECVDLGRGEEDRLRVGGIELLRVVEQREETGIGLAEVLAGMRDDDVGDELLEVRILAEFGILGDFCFEREEAGGILGERWVGIEAENERAEEERAGTARREDGRVGKGRQGGALLVTLEERRTCVGRFDGMFC